jgi:hypothetical protein
MSPYQQRILAALRHGARLHFMTGLHARWFVDDSTFKPSPSQATVDVLIRAGVIELVKEDWRGSEWRYKL